MDISFDIFLVCVLAVMAAIGLASIYSWRKWQFYRHVRRHRRQCTRGSVAFEAADYDAALTEFRALVDCPLCGRPNEVGLTMVGLCLQLQGQYESALAAYERAHELAPHYSAPMKLLAYLLAAAPHDNLRDGQRARALAIKACKSSDNTDWVALTILAGAEAELGRFDEAVAVYEQALALMPESESQARQESLDHLRSGGPFRCNPELDHSRIRRQGEIESTP